MSHPERLGRYPITGVLGEGAMGVVYRAFDPVIKRPLAIKTIRRQLDDGDTAVDSFGARFRNEAEAAGRLHHPGIVAVYEYGEDETRAFITMEFVEGTSLAQLIARKSAFGERQAVDIVAQLLEALHHAHEQGVWHRDVKPANLILTPSGRLKVADFGIARIESAALTQVASTIGTPGHMAPEQYTGETLDHRVDIFAAGVLLYQLLTGQMPFTGSSESVMYKVLNEAPLPPSQLDVSRSAFDAVVLKALAKKPADRHATAAAFRVALLAVAETEAGLGETSSDATVIVGARQPPAVGTLPMAGAGSQADAATSPSRAPVTGSSGATMLAIDGWDGALLKQVERALAAQVGPLARVMVDRAARRCRDLFTLQDLLAEQMQTAAERAAFFAALGPAPAASERGPATAAAPAPSSAGLSASTAAIDDVVLTQAVKLLAAHIGPIAKVVARKAALQGGSREQFYARLAAQVDSDDERRQLLAALAGIP